MAPLMLNNYLRCRADPIKSAGNIGLHNKYGKIKTARTYIYVLNSRSLNRCDKKLLAGYHYKGRPKFTDTKLAIPGEYYQES